MIETMLLKCNACLKSIDKRWPLAHTVRSRGLKQTLVVTVADLAPVHDRFVDCRGKQAKLTHL